MSIPLWAHAYDNYILTSKGSNPSQDKQTRDLQKQSQSKDPKIAADAYRIGRNKGASSTRRGRRYQSIIVLPVEEMSDEDLQYVLDYASDSEDIEMDGQNYMMGDVRPDLYKLLNKSDWVPVPSRIDDNNLIKEKPEPINIIVDSNAIEVVDTTIGSDEGEKRIGKQNSNDENPTSRIETKNYGITFNHEHISKDLKKDPSYLRVKEYSGNYVQLTKNLNKESNATSIYRFNKTRDQLFHVDYPRSKLIDLSDLNGTSSGYDGTSKEARDQSYLSYDWLEPKGFSPQNHQYDTIRYAGDKVLIAHRPGFGKTINAILLAEKHRNSCNCKVKPKILIVVPTNKIGWQWLDEILRLQLDTSHYIIQTYDIFSKTQENKYNKNDKKFTYTEYGDLHPEFKWRIKYEVPSHIKLPEKVDEAFVDRILSHKVRNLPKHDMKNEIQNKQKQLEKAKGEEEQLKIDNEIRELLKKQDEFKQLFRKEKRWDEMLVETVPEKSTVTTMNYKLCNCCQKHLNRTTINKFFRKKKELTTDQTQQLDDLEKRKQEKKEEIESQLQIIDESKEAIEKANKDKPDVSAYITVVYGFDGRTATEDFNEMKGMTRNQLKQRVDSPWKYIDRYKKYMEDNGVWKGRKGYNTDSIVNSLQRDFKNLNIKKYDDIIAKSKTNKIQAEERIRELREEIVIIENDIKAITAEDDGDKRERERKEAILDAVWKGELHYRMGPPWFSEETIHWNIYEDRILLLCKECDPDGKGVCMFGFNTFNTKKDFIESKQKARTTYIDYKYVTGGVKTDNLGEEVTRDGYITRQKETYDKFKAQVKTIYTAKTGKNEDLSVKQMKHEIAHVMKNDTSKWGKVTQVSDSNYWTEESQKRRADKKALFEGLTDATDADERAEIEDAWNAEKIKQKGSGNIYHKYRAPRNCIIVADEVHTKIKSNLTIAARAMWKYCLQTKFVVLATATPVESREELQQIFLLSEILSSNKQYYPYFPPWNPIRDWHGYNVNVFELAKRMRNKISRLNTIQNPQEFVESLVEASSISGNYKLPKDTVLETLLQISKSNDKLNNNTVRKNILLSIMTNQEEVIKGKDGKIFPSLVPIGEKGYIQCDINPIYAILDKEVPQHYLIQHSQQDRNKEAEKGGLWKDKKYDLAFDGKCGFIMKENSNGEFTAEEISWLQLNQFKKFDPPLPFYSIGVCNQNAFLGKYSSDFDERLPPTASQWESLLAKFIPHINKIDTKWSKCKWLDVNTYRKRYAEKGIPYDKVPVIPDIVSTKIKECVYLIEEKVREGKNVMVYHKNVELLRAVNHFLKMRGHRNINNDIMGEDDVLKEYIKERARTRFPSLPEKYRKLQEKLIGEEIKKIKPNIHKEYGKLREELLKLFSLVNYERYWKVTTGYDADVNKGKGKNSSKNIWMDMKTNTKMLDEIIKYLVISPVAKLDTYVSYEDQMLLSLAKACVDLTEENLTKRRMSVKLQSKYEKSIKELIQLKDSDNPIKKFLFNYKFVIKEKMKGNTTLKARVRVALDKIPDAAYIFDYNKFKQEFGLKFFLLSPVTASKLKDIDFGFTCTGAELYQLKQKEAPNRFKGTLTSCDGEKFNDKCKQVMPENTTVMNTLDDIFIRYKDTLSDFMDKIKETPWEFEYTTTEKRITDKVWVKGKITDKPLKSKLVTEPKDVKMSQSQLLIKNKQTKQNEYINVIERTEDGKIRLSPCPDSYKFKRRYKNVENLIVLVDGYVRRQVQKIINKNILFPDVYNKRIRDNKEVIGISKEEYKNKLQEIIDYGDPNIYKVKQSKMTLGWYGNEKEENESVYPYQTISYGNTADNILELKRRMEFFVPDVINYGIIEGNIKGQTQNSYPAFKDAFKKGALDVLLVSDAGIEGVDYKSCRQSVMICLEPVQIPGKEDQFNGRTVRFNSHYTLPDKMRECEKVTFYTKEFNWGKISKKERDKSSYKKDKRNTYYDLDDYVMVKEDIQKKKQELSELYYGEKEIKQAKLSDPAYKKRLENELQFNQQQLNEAIADDDKDDIKSYKEEITKIKKALADLRGIVAADDNDTVTSNSQTLAEIQKQAKDEGIIKKLIELYAEIGITKTKDQIVREAFDQHNPECMTQSQLEATYNAQLKLMLEKPEGERRAFFERKWDVNMPKQHAGIQQILKEMGITRTFEQQAARIQGGRNEQFGTICDGVQYKSNTGKSWDTYLDTYVDIRYVPCINNRAYYSLEQLYKVVKNPEDQKHQTFFCFACNYGENKTNVCEKCKTTDIDQYYYMDKNTFATPPDKLKKQRDHKNKKIRETNRKQRDCLETALTLNSVETTKYQTGDITYKIDADDGQNNNIQTDTVYFRKYFDVAPADDRKRWQDIVSNPIKSRKYKDTFDLPTFDEYKKERLTDKQQKELDSKLEAEKQAQKKEEKKIKDAKKEVEDANKFEKAVEMAERSIIKEEKDFEIAIEKEEAKIEKENLKEKIYRAYTEAGLKPPGYGRKKIDELKEIEKTLTVDIQKLKDEAARKAKEKAEEKARKAKEKAAEKAKKAKEKAEEKARKAKEKAEEKARKAKAPKKPKLEYESYDSDTSVQSEY